jgi:hypothetical protein
VVFGFIAFDLNPDPALGVGAFSRGQVEAPVVPGTYDVAVANLGFG